MPVSFPEPNWMGGRERLRTGYQEAMSVGFLSRGHRLRKCFGTIESVYIRRVSHKVGLEHQHGRVSLFWNTSMAAVFLVHKCGKKKEVAASEPLNDVLTTF